MISTPGKINLFLRVCGKRPDGYHELETVFWPLHSLTDTLELLPLQEMPEETISILCNTPGVPCDSRNLCWKAVVAFRKATGAGLNCGLQIRLDKHLPVAGGVGGGSSDAAATLLELRRLFAPQLSLDELKAIAVKLGADVPFFLTAAPALARGIGEKLTSLPYQGRPRLLLVNPGFPVSARWAYEHCQVAKPAAPGQCEALCHAMAQGDWTKVASLVHNDLEYALFHKFPLLRLLRSHLEDAGLQHVHVTGSGSTIFGFLPDSLELSSQWLEELPRRFGNSIRSFPLF